MAAEVKIKLNHAAVAEILKGAAAQAMVLAAANRIASAAGEGMATDVNVGRSRARAMVWTDTVAAREAEAKDRALLRAVDAGRG